jgi:hypothetical protein
MLRTIVVYLAVAVFAVIESACWDLETTPACLLVTLFVIPSILIFVLGERFLVRWRRAMHIGFALSLLPLSCVFLYSSIVGGEGHQMAMVFGFWYLTQALVAYIFLVCLRRSFPIGKPPS